jgi:NitT/TauT family transport system substrate-binding protein
MATPLTRPRLRRGLTAALAVLLGTAAFAACGDDDGGSAAGDTTESSGGSSGDPIVLGYSAWPGWFPWKVAEEEGIFEQVGVNVELKWFDDYLASLTALTAGSDQVVVLVNDNSAGNDAIIVDSSINSIQDLAGKKVAAEPGVVDHFLLLQGLDSVGMTEDDIDFQGLPTADAAAAFSTGQFDAAGVFAPFTLQAMERPGSKVLFDSSDFPGTIPDFLVLDRKVVEDRPEDVQKLVDAWYATLDWIEANPDEANAIMAEQAGISPEEYASLANGTRIFSADDALASLTGDEDTDLGPMADKVAAFLPTAGLVEEPPSLDGLFDDSFTQDYLDRQGT